MLFARHAYVQCVMCCWPKHGCCLSLPCCVCVAPPHAQVFVHALQKVDMRAVVGQSSSTSLAVARGTVERQVACYSSHPDELQASPSVLQLPAGGISALQLVYKPLHAGREWVSVHKHLPPAECVCCSQLLEPVALTSSVLLCLAC